MKHVSNALATTALLGVAFAPSVARAALGNLTYTPQELDVPVSYFNATTFGSGPGAATPRSCCATTSS